MKNLIKPKALKTGDLVATVSLSWGGASVFPYRYEQSKKQFETAFDVKSVEAPHARASAEMLYQNPKLRLDDLMWAFENKDVKAILTNIGGDDTIRLLPLMNEKHFEITRKNPKIFLGMSDTTVNHFMCFKAGLSSFYSPCLLFGYGENGGVPDLLLQNTKKTLFSTKAIGKLSESDFFIVDRIDWALQNAPLRSHIPSTPWRYIGSKRKVQGRLLGGCMDLFQFINGTSLWPEKEEWAGAILFLETSEERPSPLSLLYMMRNLGAQGILQELKGILFARPGGEFDESESAIKEAYLKSYEEYDAVLLKVCKEFDVDMPIVTNMDFGHTVPQLLLPYGALCEIDPLNKQVSILESAVE